MTNEKEEVENGEVETGLPVSKLITEMRQAQDGIPFEEGKVKENPFAFLNINKASADRIMEDADNSQIAKVLNHLIFGLTPCKNKQLSEEDIQEINPAGAVVASVMVVAPDIPLNHPFLILGIRLVTLYIKVRTVCNKVSEGVEALKDKLGGLQDEDFKTIEHK
jgi:hypothetical protein